MCISLYIFFTFVYDPACVSRCTSLVIRWSYCVSLPAPVLLFIFPALLVCLLFNFIEKSYCDKTNLVLFAISVTIILVKQLQMIWDCMTSFKLCQSSCQSPCICLWKIWISHYDGVLLPMHYFWNCSR